jgi:hypothetical protein
MGSGANDGRCAGSETVKQFKIIKSDTLGVAFPLYEVLN